MLDLYNDHGIRVNYEVYRNDYNRHDEEKNFCSWQELTNWLFKLADYQKDRTSFYYKAEVRSNTDAVIEVRADDYYPTHYIVNTITDVISNKILFSNGKHTAYITHCNDDVSELIKYWKEQIAHPQFKFG